MGGLRRMARAFGGMTIQGVKYVWDYDADEAVKENEMPFGSDRWRRSEMAKAAEVIAPRPLSESKETGE